MMNRREVLKSIGGGAAVSILGSSVLSSGAETPRKSKLGIASFSCTLGGQAMDAMRFLEYCHGIGAGGIQCGIRSNDPEYLRKLRETAEKYEMYIGAESSLPRNESQLSQFENQLKAIKELGCRSVRVGFGMRRYEQWSALEQYRQFEQQTLKTVQLCAPLFEKYKLYLAIENHKDFRIHEMLRILKTVDSEYVGVCIDVGNSFALLEDCMDIVKAYAPYCNATHLKDMALGEYEDGFLLADVPLGQGLLDLPEMVKIIRQAKPDIQFGLEMSTRDPLKVPYLTDKYWVTFPDTKAADFAKIMRYVRDNKWSKEKLPSLAGLSQTDQRKLEEENNKKCLVYAIDKLGL
ncbi:MAG: sugar phosphate isomerase/epimerase [Sedimentisphaerales bacterium]|nr:sugar phosphate isomerase/epimerase [Sedimentisphaerales bacterium]